MKMQVFEAFDQYRLDSVIVLHMHVYTYNAYTCIIQYVMTGQLVGDLVIVLLL